MTSGVDDHTENRDWCSSPNLSFCWMSEPFIPENMIAFDIAAVGSILDCLCPASSETNQHLIEGSFTASVAIANL
jgi:hypothetical protein